jgi:hypothetical protein
MRKIPRFLRKNKLFKIMKTKVLLLATLIGAATLSANAGIRFSFFFGLPCPPVPVVTVSAPVYVAPAAPVVAPVVYTAPVVAAAPLCPAPGYVWVPGYWSGQLWVAGCWRPGPAHYAWGGGHASWGYGGHYGYSGHGFGWHH